MVFDRLPRYCRKVKKGTPVTYSTESARLMARGDDDAMPPPGQAGDFASYSRVAHYALPLVLSNSAAVFLQFIDRMFLAWHSPESVAGAGAAGMIAICFISFASVTTGFTSVFTAQYMGAGRPMRTGPAVWQGWYLSLVFGAISFLLSFLAGPLFDWIGHSPAVKAAEIEYFVAAMRGGLAFMLTGAVMGFFIGRGDNRIVMLAQVGGILVNTVLDYAMIFGKLGFPEWGVAGAAWATVISQVFAFAVGAAVFWRRRHRELYATWSGRRLERGLCLRILRFGAPSGLRSIVELVVWSVFLGLIGLLGDIELAVTNVAFTINSLAWQPMVGVSLAVAMLVGKAQGAERPDLSRAAMRRGLVVAQAWEIVAAVAFVLFPDFFLGFFFGPETPGRETLMDEGRRLLWFVAAYCLVDAVNVVFAQGLIGAGDSWWTTKATLFLAALSLGAMLVMSRMGAGLYSFWVVATLYIAASGAAWLWRYREGSWERMKVVETVVVE